MSPDSNPVKRFRSLSGSPGDSEAAGSTKEEAGDRKVPPSTPPAVPSSYSYPRSSSSDSISRPVPERYPASPPPPPWQARPVPQESEYHQATQVPPANPATNQYINQTGRSPDTAYIIELIGGLFGFFGLGYMYAGQTGPGTTRLLIGILCNIVVGFLAAITAGIFACLVLPVYIGVAIASAASVKKLLINQYQNP